MKDSAWTRSQRPPGLGRQELRTGQEVTSLGRGRSPSVRVRDCNTRRLRHERVLQTLQQATQGPCALSCRLRAVLQPGRCA